MMPDISAKSVERLGCDPTFIGPRIELPVSTVADDAVLVDGSPVVHYTRFSLALSRSRKLCRWVAWNIDGATLPGADGADTIGREDLRFRKDPRVDPKQQTGLDVYTNNRLDRGHIARRADLLWGDREVAVQANEDSFFLTNITPQMDNFNQSAMKGVWGRLENTLLANVDEENSRVTVLGGPVLAATDQPYRTALVPLEFWKILSYQRDGELRTRGFIVTQKIEGLKDRDPYAEFHVMEKTVEEIATKAGVRFDPVLSDVQHRGRPRTRDREVRRIIEQDNEIEW